MFDLSAESALLAALTDSGWFMFLVVVAVFVVPFVVGTFLERVLKLKDVAFRIGVVLLAFALGLMPFVYQEAQNTLEQFRYEAELAKWNEKAKKYTVTAEGLEKLRTALPERCEIRR